MTRSVRLQLPWPPSVNHYWRTVSIPVKGQKGKKRAANILTPEAREYHVLVGNEVRKVMRNERGLTGKVRVDITARPPDHVRRDLDNLLKGILDSLKKSGAIGDDFHVDELTIRRATVVKSGVVEVTIEEIAGAATTSGDLFALQTSAREASCSP